MIQDFLQVLQELAERSKHARVVVTPAGKGKTEKSHKYKVMVRQYSTDEEFILYPRTFTLPKSQIIEMDGESTASMWLLTKKIKKYETVVGLRRWPGIKEVREQIELAQARIMKEDEEQAERDEMIRKEEETKRKEERCRFEEKHAKLQKIVLADGEAALAFCRRKGFRLGDIPQLSMWPRWPEDKSAVADFLIIIEFAKAQPTFEAWRVKNSGKTLIKAKKPKAKKEREPDVVLENVIVEWVEHHGTYGGKSYSRVERKGENCTVRVFGKKHEISTADGETVVKMAGPNLKILEPVS